MIQRLKTKFIVLSMSALLVLLAVIVAGMNIINYNSVISEADSVLSVLSQNKGHFPEAEIGMSLRPDNKLPPELSPETPYESRYFSVSYNEAGEISLVDVSKISAVDRAEAIELADKIISSKKEKGFAGEYRYALGEDMLGVRITFLDCGRKLDAFKSFLVSSILMSVIGYALVFAVIFILSGKIIKPIAESYEKQKQFITNAGHEIKTPLTIINANADILEMEFDEPNESLDDIKEQTKRLKTLTENLVMLSRMEESEANLSKIEFPISEVVQEAANSFKHLALSENKNFLCNIEPMLTLNGNDAAIRQLVSILLDNALKYSEIGGTVSLSLTRQNRSIVLAAHNTTATPVNSEQLKYVFDRFYRADSSRNSETGGHGIGLSIAKAIVAAHDGKIKATANDEKSFAVTAVFPI